ncbi:hypothetical protein JMUB4039_0522 [Leptotrichia trevisanii]|uniref:Uncharacterized protein n=1 Tax=Leptotrichia trevisanii TaxID=109328 RepID=A0A510KXV8_9FUSO|nr:MliC family protein [Leptotrichia trevisanii]BBM51628.1 hypothetical protein JMUB3935_0602 [Leptotrichia trevisanii]BBM56548.1 hypothetical protein JMUB4039_0522 [Leptotrichia trevisanii]
MKSTKRMVLTTLVGVLALSSIGFSAARAKSSKKASNLTRKFSCSSRNVTVQNLSTDRVKVTDENGKVYNLKLTKSGSGEEYTGGGVSIHIKGNDAVFTKSGSDESCYMTGNGNSSSSNQSSSNHLLRKYSCDGNQDVTVENLSTDKVKLADGYGGIYTLNSATSGSGEKYSNGNISIHMKGNDAIYTENGKDKSCSLQNSGHGSINE